MEHERQFKKYFVLKIAHFGTLAVFAVFASLPFLWMLITAFKQDADLYNRANNPFLFNMPPTLVHLKELFYSSPPADQTKTASASECGTSAYRL
jgi:ABC-type glycerol-3-phosphate transport system permease component